jgi:hypothetical protein
MTRRRKLLVICLTALVILATAAFYQSALIGWWRGEAKYKGRYTNSWRAEMRCYEGGMAEGNLWHLDYAFSQKSSLWENWLDKLGVRKRSLGGFTIGVPDRHDLGIVLQDGDPDAVPVLMELLNDEDPTVRLLAIFGLQRVGAAARDAVPQLLALCPDPERGFDLTIELPFAFEAEYAISSIDEGLGFSRLLRRLHLFDSSQNIPYPDTLAMMLPQTPTGFGPLLRRIADKHPGWPEFSTSNASAVCPDDSTPPSD